MPPYMHVAVQHACLQPGKSSAPGLKKEQGVLVTSVCRDPRLQICDPVCEQPKCEMELTAIPFDAVLTVVT